MTKAEKTRQLIIDKAAPIFNTKGIAGTSMSDIMAATNLAKGSLYVHFEDKEELAQCVVNHNLQMFRDRVNAAMSSGFGFKQKLLAMLDYYRDPLNPKVEGGCPILNFGAESNGIHPSIRQTVDKTVVNMQQTIARIINNGVKAGEFKEGWNSEEFAIKSFAMLEGALLFSRLANNKHNMTIVIGILKKEIEENSI